MTRDGSLFELPMPPAPAIPAIDGSASRLLGTPRARKGGQGGGDLSNPRNLRRLEGQIASLRH